MTAARTPETDHPQLVKAAENPNKKQTNPTSLLPWQKLTFP
jgi:hypothetical protein